MRRHLVLVGLPGSGKSTVGRLAARMLQAPFVDPDVDVERRAGKTIAEIFASAGEAEFRRLERDAVRRALDEAAAVVAPGGGWGTAAEALDEAHERGALVIYLRCAPREAARRLGDCRDRPLLSDAADPAARMGELLAAREPRYLAAGHTVDTDGRTVDRVARAVVALARRHGGW